MEKIDTIGRRKSNAVKDTGKEVRLTSYDHNAFRGARRYPCINTNLLARFWKPDGNLDAFRDRAKHLTHEKLVYDLDGRRLTGPMLVRPWELNPPPPNPQPAWYEISDAAAELVETKAPRVPLRDDKRHRAMGSCIGASFELLAPEYGMTALHHEELFLHPRCPDATRQATNPLEVKLRTGKYEPDALMGFKYDAGGFRFFIREHDRGGVSFERSDKNQTSNRAKLDRILQLFDERAYETHWGLPSLMAMFITTSEDRIPPLMEYLQGKRHGHRVIFKVIPRFHRRHWDAPREPMAELFDTWQAIDGEFDITKP